MFGNERRNRPPLTGRTGRRAEDEGAIPEVRRRFRPPCSFTSEDDGRDAQAARGPIKRTFGQVLRISIEYALTLYVRLG